MGCGSTKDCLKYNVVKAQTTSMKKPCVDSARSKQAYERLWRKKCEVLNVPVLNIRMNLLYNKRVGQQATTERCETSE